jgi:histone deacetylase 6
MNEGDRGMASNEDDAMIDVEDTLSGPATTTSSQNATVPAKDLVVSVAQPGQILLNGSGQNSGPSTTPDSLASPVKPANQSSRDWPIPGQDQSENLAAESSTKAEPFSVDVSSDEPGSDTLLRRSGIVVATLPTGLCYDVRMRYHCELDPPKQRLDFHPEDPRRIYFIYKELCKAGLVAEDKTSTSTSIFPKQLHRVNIRYATKEEICLVHDAKHFEFVKSTKGI